MGVNTCVGKQCRFLLCLCMLHNFYPSYFYSCMDKYDPKRWFMIKYINSNCIIVKMDSGFQESVDRKDDEMASKVNHVKYREQMSDLDHWKKTTSLFKLTSDSQHKLLFIQQSTLEWFARHHIRNSIIDEIPRQGNPDSSEVKYIYDTKNINSF